MNLDTSSESPEGSARHGAAPPAAHRALPIPEAPAAPESTEHGASLLMP
ncbi:MAG: hypothetical protein PHF72_07050 [Gammaproteobacteria bacterium]|nr:hypothetical protein [Gammaproteobacteria bacterium]